jgi:hypothetical protein
MLGERSRLTIVPRRRSLESFTSSDSGRTALERKAMCQTLSARLLARADEMIKLVARSSLLQGRISEA